ncbi:MAG: glycoside hydrolase family 31 protein [Telluria sp.]
MKKAAAWALSLTLMTLLQSGNSYAGPVTAPGAVVTGEVQGDRLRLKTEHAVVELTLYTPSVLRVRMDRQPLGRDFSYAVVARPAGHSGTITDLGNEYLIKTAALTAHVAKQPFALRVESADGKLITQDEPGLTTSWIGDQVTTYKSLQEGERFLGLGEKTGGLDRRGNAYTNWNTDAFKYVDGTDPLYATIPFYIGVHHGLAYGIFLDNSYRTDFNFGASNKRFSSFTAHGGEMNYYVIAGPKVADVIGSYTALTGRMPLPPLWSLGYQQNRYSYMSDADVMRVAHTLREKRLPADGITLDIHYMDEYKVFSWNKERYPDPAGLVKRLQALGMKLTVIVDPGIKADPKYAVFNSGTQQDAYVKYVDGTPYSGEVWPGWVHFPDFTAARGRAWWAQQVGSYAKAGVAGLWNDMNEFSTWGQAAPANILFDFDGQPTTHLEARNVYGLNMTRASYEGMKQATGQRPFILSRSGFAGTQRYSAMWTGDNQATDEHMLLGVRMLASMGLSGLPFTGMDIGGFMGNRNAGLYARWMEIGAFTPYFRNHSAYDTAAAEPWTFGEDALNVARNYINLRYRLLPYLYGAFHDAAATGLPVMRSLAIDYTDEAPIYDGGNQNEYLFGPSFLVLPFESTRDAGKAYFPRGRWYSLYDDSVEQGGQEKLLELRIDRLPVYVKAGAIVPMQSLVQSTAERPQDTLFLHVWRGEAPSSFSYYEDDGSSFAYEHGGFYQREIRVDPAARRVEFGKAVGSLYSKFSKIEVVLHGFGGDQSWSAIDGAASKVITKTAANDSQAFSITY